MDFELNYEGLEKYEKRTGRAYERVMWDRDGRVSCSPDRNTNVLTKGMSPPPKWTKREVIKAYELG
jgi:hypothetical protein